MGRRSCAAAIAAGAALIAAGPARGQDPTSGDDGPAVRVELLADGFAVTVFLTEPDDGTASARWSLLLGFGARSRPSAAVILALFVTGAQGAALGALMAFSGSSWYGVYGPGAALWSVTPLGDQQLAGLVMWGAGGLGPVIAGAILLVAWLDRLERFPRTPAPMR